MFTVKGGKYCVSVQSLCNHSEDTDIHRISLKNEYGRKNGKLYIECCKADKVNL